MTFRHPFAAALQMAAMALLALAVAPQAVNAAETVPDTTSMIEALKPSASRSMRNLQVRKRTDDAASASASASSSTSPASAAAQAAADAAAQAAATAPASGQAGPAPNLSLAIQFENNSSQVRAESGPVLGNLVAALQSPELKGMRFAIEGHTDAAGPAARNLALSQQRADEVRLYLVALGVHPSRLKAVGKGAAEPVNPLAPLAAENRRVRVVTLQ